MTGGAFLAVIAFVIGIAVAYRAGVRSKARDMSTTAAPPALPAAPATRPDEPSRLLATSLDVEPELHQLRAFAEERRKLFSDLADARANVARYRQIVIDIERNAPPPLLDAPGTPDDLKLIVGVGPVIERMLYQMGIGTYRQIARWTERDIDDFDARLAEFPGRIRRDAWVTQARALHASKYGIPP